MYIGKQSYILLLLESAIADKNKKAVDIQPEEAVSSVGEKKISKPRKPRAKKGVIIYFKTIMYLTYFAFDFAVLLVDKPKDVPVSKGSPLRQDTLDAAFARTIPPVSTSTVPETTTAAISAWQGLVSTSAPVSRGPGRPAGAKNKPLSSTAQSLEKRPGDSKFPMSSWSLTITKVATDPLNKDVKKDLLTNMKQFLDDCCIRGIYKNNSYYFQL